MNMINHIKEQPFIVATGLAALIHSTWSLGTLFSGEQPEWSNPHVIGWLIPAFLIAFALDVGQISTSAQIRNSGLTLSRAITFLVFALATWYLQWLYIAHHMPALALADGISELHKDAALFLRDMAMWVIPALLPLSTLLYTFSGETRHYEKHTIAIEDKPTKPIEIVTIDHPEIPLLQAEMIHNGNIAICDCGWIKEYDNADSASKGLRMHKSRYCELYIDVLRDSVEIKLSEDNRLV